MIKKVKALRDHIVVQNEYKLDIKKGDDLDLNEIPLGIQNALVSEGVIEKTTKTRG